MKIKVLIISGFLLMTSQFGCEKWLELIPPEGLIREEFWKSRQDVDAVVMGIYESF